MGARSLSLPPDDWWQVPHEAAAAAGGGTNAVSLQAPFFAISRTWQSWGYLRPGASTDFARSTANSGCVRMPRKWQLTHWTSLTARSFAWRPRCSTWQDAQYRSGAAAAFFGSPLPNRTWAPLERR